MSPEPLLRIFKVIISAINVNRKLTIAGVRGATMEPILPIIDEYANRLCRCFVGYSSVVYT